MKRKHGDEDLEDFLSEGSDYGVTSENEGGGEAKETITDKHYAILMNDPKFLLTLQPRMYETQDSDEAEQDDF